jgi:hypothetical protein
MRMRTTITIDDDILQAVRSIAKARHVSVGRALSDLARKGIERTRNYSTRNDLPVFSVREDAPVVTPEQVKSAEEEW